MPVSRCLRPKAKRLTLKAEGLKRRGFSLIEMLVVMSILGMTFSLVTVAYRSYERNQRLRIAASGLKSDLRLAQSKALAGDKGSTSECRTSDKTLRGWYVTFNTASANNKRYVMEMDCKTPAGEVVYASKSTPIPKEIYISGINIGGSSVSSAKVLFQPLSGRAVFLNDSSPPFFDSGGNIDVSKTISGTSAIVTLSSPSGGTYQVIVNSSGEVNEKES